MFGSPRILFFYTTIVTVVFCQQRQQQDLVNSFLDFILNSQQNSRSSKKCIPYKLPEGYTTYQEYCKSLSIADDKLWDDKYKLATAPTNNQPFPLTGCILGCLVGKESFQRGIRWGAGSWSGKCIRNTADVINLLTPLPSFGGVFNVLDSLNWTQLLPVIEQYPGSLQTGLSWYDALYSMPRNGKLEKAWTITYETVVAPSTNANSSALEQTVAMYAQLIRGSRDEIRLIDPGGALGYVFRMPNSYLNPTPFPVNTGVRFLLMQVCDRRGNFANGGNTRYLKEN